MYETGKCHRELVKEGSLGYPHCPSLSLQEVRERALHDSREEIQAEGTCSKCKGPEVGMDQGCSRHSQAICWLGVD